MSILKPETSVMVGVSTAALVGFIYSYGVPSMATVHATAPQDVNVDAGRKKAAWTGAAAVALLSLMTRDKTVFVIGGLAVVALDFHARLANAANPGTGKIISNEGYQPAATSVASTAPDDVDMTGY